MRVVLRNVCKDIKGARVLDNVNLELESGRVYGFKGKNGSGKTMLMRAISGLIKVKGEIEIDGKILGKDFTFPPSIGILIENPSFVAEYTGLKNLEMLACIKNKIGIEDIRHAMEQVGLDPDDKRTYKKYSLGMKQKLGIAAAFMEKPDIIILDEPINALDEAGAKQVHKILEEQKKRGALIIIACHAKELMKKFPFKMVASVWRTETSITTFKLQSMIYTEGKAYYSKEFFMHILDYIGAGDAYCAGLIYSLINNFDPQKAVEFSNAASCLKHTVSGDYNLVTVDEVMKLAFSDAGNEVQR